ncbi:MAG TPA: LysM domain-containing protein [Solirubrobacterales bacterium]|nr:LysM domain-containing protein [Solirubrobacterales bacterium]
MNQRYSSLARVIASAALICGFIVVVVVVASSLGGDGSDGSGGRPAAAKNAKGEGHKSDEPPKSYVVQNGDTLTSIAHRTGVSVARIQELNPGVDPQILVSGEKLKLR